MKQFGLIGKSLNHSFSARYFNGKFAKEILSGCRYDLFPLNSITELNDLINRTDHLTGLNVTIPYKTSVIALLDELDETAEIVGAVNTIKIFRVDGKIKTKGFNTDTWGFEHSTNAFVSHPHALVLGTGGAAKAITFVLRKKAIDYLMVSRLPKETGEISYNDIDEVIMKKYRWIINATPVGMVPDQKVCPPLPYHLITKDHFLYDLVYNPAKTIFLAKGKQSGAKTMNGLRMLKLQAEKSWDIWNNIDDSGNQLNK
ncbi:MAG: shikimate dehydrogenase [Bacteroidales bacterium]|nr:shikimate dehydrogenase [Bacteroidales bacterium]